ncbi:MAG TPA: hypothetical protein VGO47_10245, partial [Chlamydiales bacterium]|nr:hypothetical protein [Chlamydiales bacterium]
MNTRPLGWRTRNWWRPSRQCCGDDLVSPQHNCEGSGSADGIRSSEIKGENLCTVKMTLFGLAGKWKAPRSPVGIGKQLDNRTNKY